MRVVPAGFFQSFSLDKQHIAGRVRARISVWEFFAVLIAIAMVFIFVWLMRIGKGYPVDFQYYMEDETSPLFFYGYWILPIFNVLKSLPFETAYVIWCLINIFSLLFAVRVFGGKPILVLLSYQLFSTLYYGQLSGVLAGGLALCWWGISSKKWHLAGLGFLIALTKYQVGLTMGLLLIWYAGVSKREFLKIMIVPFLIFLLTLIPYPNWPFEILNKLSNFEYVHLGITLWYFIGAWSLLFWLPALLLPMSRSERFLSLFSLCAFAVPYFSQIDLLTLISFPIGFIPLLGNLGYLFTFFRADAIRLLVIVPLLCYLGVILPAFGRLIEKSD